MNFPDFEKVLEKRIELTRKVLASKNKEYARGDDKLHNFKRGSARLKETPERYLMELNEKHLCSIMDMIDDLDKGQCANMAVWEEKIGDAVNYLILLEALLVERIDATCDREIQNQPAVEVDGRAQARRFLQNYLVKYPNRAADTVIDMHGKAHVFSEREIWPADKPDPDNPWWPNHPWRDCSCSRCQDRRAIVDTKK